MLSIFMKISMLMAAINTKKSRYLCEMSLVYKEISISSNIVPYVQPIYHGPYENSTSISTLSHYPNTITLFPFQSHFPLFNPTIIQISIPLFVHQSHSFECTFIIPLLLFLYIPIFFIRPTKGLELSSYKLGYRYGLENLYLC